MTSIPAYTLDKTLTQQAVIERSTSSVDALGAPTTPDWETIATVACRIWWTKSDGVRSADRTYVDADRQVPVSSGGMMLPSGTDVLETDRIVQINQWDAQSRDWVLYFTGPLQIVTVLNEGTHIEIAFNRIQLGG